MCGIVGCVSPSGVVDPLLITRMASVIKHRGPDGGGEWLSDNRTVGFGHRRLSIIDLSEQARQPMQSEETGLVLSFNGEIYNHRELRAQLKSYGVQFRTDHSDTETLLEAIGHWGVESTLQRVIGMFAFAIYDPREQVVYLARDRIGVKPLYVAQRQGEWLFASEAKALFVHPKLNPALDLSAFSQYLGFRFVPGPRTLFEGVEKVGAGELWRIDVHTGRLRRQTYWDPLQAPVMDRMGWGEAVDTLEELIMSSVRYRLESDVSVGVFLSGGVDSSLLLKAANSCGAKGLQSYTITYPGYSAYDESATARDLAAECAENHHEVPADVDSFAGLMGRIAYYLDEPVAAPVCLPVYLLSQAARETGVPVVLAGEGADELFIGYDRWLKMRDIEKWNQRTPDLPRRPARRLLRRLAGCALPYNARSWDVLDRAAKGQPLFWGGAMDFGSRERQKLIGPNAQNDTSTSDFEEVIEPALVDFLRARPANDVTGWMTYLDLRYRLPELMLPRLDKMGMAHSVEGRVPFLDHRIAEFAITMPPELHEAKGKIGKRVLKEVASRRLPREFVFRRKKGFRAPVAEWKETPASGLYLEALQRFASRTGLLDRQAVAAVLSRRDDRLYFNLVNFMLWYISFIENPVADLLPAFEGTEMARSTKQATK